MHDNKFQFSAGRGALLQSPHGVFEDNILTGLSDSAIRFQAKNDSGGIEGPGPTNAVARRNIIHEVGFDRSLYHLFNGAITVGLLDSYSPIFENGPIHDSILEWSRRFDGSSLRSVYVPLERHAYITHRQISEAIHRDYSEIKQSLINQGIEFMGELKSLRAIGAITYEMSEYLADFYLRSTMTMIDGRDPDLVPLKSSVDELLDQPKSIAPKTTLKFLQNNNIVNIRSDIDSLSQKEARALLESSLKQPYKEDCLLAPFSHASRKKKGRPTHEIVVLIDY